MPQARSRHSILIRVTSSQTMNESIRLRIASPRNHRERVSHCIIKNHTEMVLLVTAPREVS